MNLLDNFKIWAILFEHCWIVAQDAAKSVRFLKHLRITHVLNTAEGQDENLVDLSAAHYEGTGIEYKVIPWSRSKLNFSNASALAELSNSFFKIIVKLHVRAF